MASPANAIVESSAANSTSGTPQEQAPAQIPTVCSKIEHSTSSASPFVAATSTLHGYAKLLFELEGELLTPAQQSAPGTSISWTTTRLPATGPVSPPAGYLPPVECFSTPIDGLLPSRLDQQGIHSGQSPDLPRSRPQRMHDSWIGRHLRGHRDPVRGDVLLSRRADPARCRPARRRRLVCELRGRDGRWHQRHLVRRGGDHVPLQLRELSPGLAQRCECPVDEGLPGIRPHPGRCGIERHERDPRRPWPATAACPARAVVRGREVTVPGPRRSHRALGRRERSRRPAVVRSRRPSAEQPQHPQLASGCT